MQFTPEVATVGQLAGGAWLAPEQLTGLTEGAPIEDWPGVPGTAHAATLLIPPPPTYHVDSQTGKGGALFGARLPGVFDQAVMELDPALPLPGDWTLFCVARTLVGGTHGPFVGNAGADHELLGVDEVELRVGWTPDHLLEIPEPPALGELHFWGTVRSGTTVYFYRDGTLLDTMGGVDTAFAWERLYAWYGAPPGGYCWIPEVIVLPVALTAGEAAAIWSYLAAKYQESADMLTGAILPFAGSVVPSGYLACDGADVSRATYPELFSALGTSWGAGDGSTTFGLPDLRGRSPVGTSPGALGSDRPTARALAAVGGDEKHVLTQAELPNVNFGVTDPGHAHGTQGGGNFDTQDGTTGAASGGFPGGDSGANETNNATTSVGVQSGGADSPHNNMHPFAVIAWVIKT